ncbi:hypothetical protein CLV78_102109 [Aliiruegeria haliotis]|uniref:Uncharacterized protein n=1 Tax=Aliiruegeria haliotis TaxID=1280846 RepID=A0A2T0RUQ5_9RHOB|nr:hypothetical protein [Aliiruegeria haliotis]PRY24936.1 hypothetical protein CLV78_102109 [Aliiruegeria haliotis]
MPDLLKILAFYQLVLTFSMAGALPGECRAAAEPERSRVCEAFLSRSERNDLASADPRLRDARLRKGYLRFESWERANPDIVAVLMRKAAT